MITDSLTGNFLRYFFVEFDWMIIKILAFQKYLERIIFFTFFCFLLQNCLGKIL